MDISQFLVDDELNALRGSFLVEGRGRPKKIPSSLPCTKKLLIQLKTVCDEGNRQLNDVFAWFCNLYPETKIDKSKFIKQVQQTVITAERILADGGEEKLKIFLDSRHELFFIADELSAIGITSLELDDPKLFENIPSNMNVTNGAVLQLHYYVTRNKIKFSTLAVWLNHLLSANYSEEVLSSSVNYLHKEIQRAKKYKNRKPLVLQELLNLPFVKKIEFFQDNCKNYLPQKKTKNFDSTTEHSSSTSNVITQSVSDCQDDLANLKIKFEALTSLYQTASQKILSLKTENVRLKKSVRTLMRKSSKLAGLVQNHERLSKIKLYKKNYRLKKQNNKTLSIKTRLNQRAKTLMLEKVELKANKQSLQKAKFSLKKKYGELSRNSSLDLEDITADDVHHMSQ